MSRLVSRFMIFFSMVFVLASCGGGGGGGDSTPPPVPVITAMNGGLAGSGSAGSLFVIDGTGFGTLGAPAGGYSVDFKDVTSGSIVAPATVNYAAGGWTDAVIIGTVPNLPPGTTYKVTVTTAGGTSNAMDFLVVASVAFSPSTITWSASTSTLPAAMQGFPSVVSTLVSTTTTTSYIYILGGNIATSATAANGKAANTDAVYMSRLDNTTGGLATAWTPTTALPAKLGFSAAVFANKFNSFVDGNGHVYVMGGLNSQGTATTVVYHAVVNDDGGLGAWTETTALPQALSSHGAVIYRNHIYVAGGNGTDGNPVKTVYSAKVKSDGTLEAWTAQPDLPEVRAYHQFVTVAGYLYVIGGDNAAADPLKATAGSSADTIYYNQINLANGNLVNATWSSNATGTGKPREKFSAVVAGSDIVVTGGLYAGQLGSSESRYAQINSDGSVGAANGATGTNTIDSLSGFNPYNQSTAFFADASGKPHILILGGTDGVTGVSSAGVFMSNQ